MVAIERFRAVRELFDEAADLSPSERSQYFQKKEISPSLVTEVTALLAAHEAEKSIPARNMFDRPIADGIDLFNLDLIGHEVGPFKIEKLLGEGGVGCVYLAEQSKPIRRRVALKVVKPGMDTRQVLARFEYERDALGLLNHPNVAKVFEAGATQQGRPYFAMEYVPGTPITIFCDERRLSIDERLRLFVDACSAVQHAHQAGIIHRDLKPSNILVADMDGKAVPKVIDFGIAKAMSRGQSGQSFLTDVGLVMGTPGYMSPEQFELGITATDVRTDVFSLGVVLYELLVRRLPFDNSERAGSARGSSFDQVDELVRPSACIPRIGQEAANCRGLDLSTLRRRLQGDLDWITLKALEQNRDRRYSTVAALINDLQRHLTGFPIEARPQSRSYRLKKMLARNKTGAIAGSIVVLSIIAGTIASQVQRERAIASEQDARKVADFYADMVKELDPNALGEVIREQLRGEAERTALRQVIIDANGISRQLSKEETEQALASFDRSMLSLSMASVAARVIEVAVVAPASEAVESEFAVQPRIALKMRNTLVNQFIRLGSYGAAETEANKAMELSKHPDIPEDSGERLAAILQLANILERQERLAEAECLQRAALEIRRRYWGEQHVHTLASMSNLAVNLARQGRIVEAVPIQEQVLGLRIQALGPRHEEVASSKVSLGSMLNRLERYDEARTHIAEALEIRLELFGKDHEKVLGTIGSLAAVFVAQGQYEEAAQHLRQMLETLRLVLGDRHPKVAMARSALATCLVELGAFAEAERLCREALPVLENEHQDDHSNILITLARLGMALSGQGRFDEAETLLVESYEKLRERNDVAEYAKKQLVRAIVRHNCDQESLSSEIIEVPVTEHAPILTSD